MNFTLGLLGGLVLILPGLAALVAWQAQTGRDGVRRADVSLTSLAAIVLVLSVSLVAHLLGWALSELAATAVREIATMDGAAAPPLDNPYELVVRLAEKRTTGEELNGIVLILAIVALEACLAFAVVWSRGLALAIGDFDFGNQGWVFQAIVKPTRYGSRPQAYVLTAPASGEPGLAYRGVVVEFRQTPDGEFKGVTLANPDTFVYSVREPSRPEDEPDIRLSASRVLSGIVSLEAAAVRNILIQQIPDAVVDLILGPDAAEGQEEAADD